MSEREHGRARSRELIDELGVMEVGRRYVTRDGQWDELAVTVFGGEDEDGHELPLELWWDILMAAIEACPDDDGSFWLLGDGPFDHMRIKPGVNQRLLEERTRNPKVARLFDAMQRELPKEGVTAGFWFE